MSKPDQLLVVREAQVKDDGVYIDDKKVSDVNNVGKGGKVDKGWAFINLEQNASIFIASNHVDIEKVIDELKDVIAIVKRVNLAIPSMAPDPTANAELDVIDGKLDTIRDELI